MKTYSDLILIISLVFVVIVNIKPIEIKSANLDSPILISEIRETKMRTYAVGKIYKKPLSRKIQIETQEYLNPGDLIKVKGQIQKTDPKNPIGTYLRSKNIYSQMQNPKIKKIKTLHTMSYYKGKIKEKYSHMLNTLYQEQSPIIDSLITGNKENLTQSKREIIIKSGTAHLFSISGFHIGLLFCLTTYILNKFPITMVKRDLISAIILITYISWCNYQISCTRAFLFILSYIIAKIIKRPYNTLNTAKTLFGLTLIQNPYTIYSPGFCLSYLAVMSIAMFNRPIEKAIYKKYYPLILKKNLSTTLINVGIITISAQILTIPYTYYKFKSLCTVSLLTNLISVNLISFCYIFILSSIILYPIRILAKIMAKAAKFILTTLYFLPNKILISLPLSYIETNQPSTIKIIIFYIILISLYNIHRKKQEQKNKL